MKEQTVTKRRRRDVVTLLVEIDASQARTLDSLIEKLGITKTKAIAAALNIWFSSVEPPQESE